MKLDQYDHGYDDSDVLRKFSLPEAKALVDLSYLMIYIDGEVSDEELQTLRAQIERMPFANSEQVRAVLGDHINRVCRALTTIVADDDEVADFIDSAAGRIAEGAHRRTALEVLSLILFCRQGRPRRGDDLLSHRPSLRLSPGEHQGRLELRPRLVGLVLRVAPAYLFASSAPTPAPRRAPAPTARSGDTAASV